MKDDSLDWKKTIPFKYLGPESFTLSLSRSAIKLHHDQAWSVKKTNSVYDLFCCLEGSAEYRIGEEDITVKEGDMVLLDPDVPFEGHIRGDCKLYTGIAQHFEYKMFGLIDFFSLIKYQNKITLQNWKEIKPVVQYFHHIAPVGDISFHQVHLFQVLLVEYVKHAFIEMKFEKDIPFFVLETAAEIEQRASGNKPFDEIVTDLPYSKRYLDDVFKNYTGKTLKQFWMYRKLQRAEKLLHAGASVKETSFRLGFTDPLYFSRLFKNKRGYSPSEVKMNH